MTIETVGFAYQLQDEPDERRGCRCGQRVRAEGVAQPEHVADEQDVREVSHRRDVQVGRVGVVLGLHRLILRVLDGPVGVTEGEQEETYGERDDDLRGCAIAHFFNSSPSFLAT